MSVLRSSQASCNQGFAKQLANKLLGSKILQTSLMSSLPRVIIVDKFFISQQFYKQEAKTTNLLALPNINYFAGFVVIVIIIILYFHTWLKYAARWNANSYTKPDNARVLLMGGGNKSMFCHFSFLHIFRKGMLKISILLFLFTTI